MAKEIADHVAGEYHLNKKGTQLVAVVSGPPQVTSGTRKVTISNIAVSRRRRPTRASRSSRPASTWTDQLCGLAPSCSIASGQATETRGRLVRREALEVALYTFKFVPAIKSIVAFMPPPPGSTAIDAPVPAEGEPREAARRAALEDAAARQAAAADAARQRRGADDRQADAPGGLQVLAASSSRTRAPCSS